MLHRGSNVSKIPHLQHAEIHQEHVGFIIAFPSKVEIGCPDHR